ncbi:hypothetical protein [Pelotomaculum propionicicum]|uniref:Uncharacterized protein n=1 Tax=Pelotomaculum propionicicum TaxID=258475 RepID=A0A4Y7RWI0_9FIRM|nr:hypothetical protein [Pelotomaculum propionicicum]TEB13344.1 hypothetical protein Pmgp_00238 [Pelotomaculum propionicicum]
MAKYTVTRACGHEETVVLFGKLKDRDWRLEKVEPQKLCSECYQAKLAEEREKENREAAEVAKEQGLPALAGSEKQVAWAETIRQQMLADIDEFIYKRVKPEHRNKPELLTAIDHIRNTVEARWWIDNRGMNLPGELMHLVAKAAKEVKAKKLQPAISEAKTEATVRPENPKTDLVAEIRSLDSAVEISFPERRDDFRELVRGIGYRWESNCWRRKLSAKNGTPQDRAAEAGHRLLAAGFAVRIYDEAIRARAIAGDYEPECTRWVQLRTSEKYTGWLAINWSRPDDFYKAAKRIAGARWSSPSVVVPPENFEEVLDFAQMYGFKVSDMALEAIEQARRDKEAALVVSVEAPKEKPREIASGKPPVLEVPAEVGINDEFREG